MPPYPTRLLCCAAAALLTACSIPQAPSKATSAPASPVVAVAATTAPPPSIFPPPPTYPTPASSPGGAASPTTPPPAPGEPRKYETVITKEAKTARGLLIHHKIKERHYFEIPEKLLGRDLLWSAEVAQASRDVAFNGLSLGYKVVRFERVDNRILLRGVTYRKRGSEDLKAATDAVELAPILLAFNVEAEGSEQSLELRADEKKALEAAAKPDKATDEKASDKDAPASAATPDKPSEATPAKDGTVAKDAPTKPSGKPAPKEKWPVIDATRLVLATSSDLLDARSLGPSGLAATDFSRSLVNQVKVFPQNIEIRSTFTFASVPQVNPFSNPGGASAITNPSRSALLHYSLALLPQEPMMGRYFDPRVGYFSEGFQEYGRERNGVRFREFITRFRLEKKDPSLPLSEPVKPIVFYIAPEVPEKWRKYLKLGIEDWREAFEQAGFKDAIIAKDAPTNDPNWDAEDARYSVIRWVAQPIANAYGPHLHDPRSGEVLSAHIVFWHDILRWNEQLYFIQAGAADPRVSTLPLPDEVMGETMRYVAAHEVGHALGLRHNHRASSTYSVKQLRDPVFAQTQGTVASIMAYGRFNSVAQPGDHVSSFVPKIGPYDRFAIEWGYKPLDKKTSDEELPDLDRLSARQLDDSRLTFGGDDLAAAFDPQVQIENIGKERIAATRLSLASLERAAAKLIPATTKLGEDYEDLTSTYSLLITQRYNYLRSVIKLIGGVRETRYLGGRGGDTFTRATPAEQREAIRFLLDEALQTPKWLLAPTLLNKIQNFAVSAPVINSQRNLLREMLWPLRFRLLEDAELLEPGSGMTASQYLAVVQKGLFRELAQANPKIDITRRELQRTYLDQLKAFSGETQRLNSFGAIITALQSEFAIDLRPAALEALKQLKTSVLEGSRRSNDPATRLHLTQLAREIEQIVKIQGS